MRPFYCSGSGIDLVEFPVDAGNVTLVGKTEVAVVPDDKVFVHCDIGYATGEDQSSRDGNVVRRWLRVARGVVVRKDQSRRLILQGRAHDFAWIDRTGGQSPLEKRFGGNHTVFGIEIDGSEVFLLLVPHAMIEKIKQVPGVVQRILVFDFPGQVTVGNGLDQLDP